MSPSCFNCIYHNPQMNICYAYALPPANARRYPHLCGPDAKGFRHVILRRRRIPEKDEVFKPENDQVNDF
jgi:hypothetical protein